MSFRAVWGAQIFGLFIHLSSRDCWEGKALGLTCHHRQSLLLHGLTLTAAPEQISRSNFPQQDTGYGLQLGRNYKHLSLHDVNSSFWMSSFNVMFAVLYLSVLSGWVFVLLCFVFSSSLLFVEIGPC